jgi:hypothetical protein
MPSNDHPVLHRAGYAEQESAIMDLLRASGRLTVEEIAEQIPDLSWSQLFLAVDVLSRTGEVILWREGFTYTLEAAKPAPVLETASHGTTAADHR